MGLGTRHLLNVLAVFKSFYDELDLFQIGKRHPWSTATSAPFAFNGTQRPWSPPLLREES